MKSSTLSLEKRETLSAIKEELSKANYHLSWAGMWFDEVGAIAVSELISKIDIQLGDEIEASNMLASTYYAACGNALSQVEVNEFDVDKSLWKNRADDCIKKAQEHSDRVVELSGIEKMSVGALDVRSSILRKIGKYEEALTCSELALTHPSISIEAQAIVEIGIAIVRGKMGDHTKAENEFKKIIEYSKSLDPHVGVRVHKSYALYLIDNERMEDAQNELSAALLIAQDNDFQDQITKLRPLMEKSGMI